ncbi:3'-5' exonuclease [Humibacter sp. BT305]|uniref:3'-5' exonuclease n=1 Tax=Cnuibacter physcomitrellae TaxID=1619308 RepID=UPI000E0A36AB|nr:3'-5' exonuclease [Cnuibacter physcomitrellae]AXH36026.1 3'-5' exonuclease [Humibacter sp. BT305]MCS5496983.1 3'-5' exonuclease [Cnuibacter physcomitrellae]
MTLEVTRATLPKWATRLAVFDLETTGIDVETSRIVTANVSMLDEHGQVVDRHDWIADPGVEIPEGATAVHGITTAQAREVGRRAADVVDEVVFTLRTVLADSYAVVVYNAPYDFTLLDRECARHGIRPLGEPGAVVDPLVIDRRVDRYRKGKRTLTAASDHYGVTLTDAHNAGADAIAAGRVALALAERYADDLAFDAASLHRAQVDWHDEQCASFEDYMRRTRDPHFTARRGWPLIPIPAHPTLF